MKRSLVEIYALAVCFVTISCFAITFGVAVYDLIQITNPEFTLNAHEYQKHETNKAFIDACYNEERQEKLRAMPDEEVTALRTTSFERALKSEKRDALQSLAMNMIIIVIDAVLFALHWLIARRVRMQVAAE